MLISEFNCLIDSVASLFHYFHLTASHLLCYRLSEDTAWNPVSKDEFESSPLLRKAIIYGYGPFRCWMSIAHWYKLIMKSFII